MRRSDIALVGLGTIALVLGVAEERVHTSLERRTGAGACRAIDGDTLRCGDERVRLNGIDAPELPGHCRVGRACVPGDPFASRDNLAQLAAAGTATFERLKTDHYGRTVAEVTIAGVDLSCAQVRGGYARYVARWDEDGTTAARCNFRHPATGEE